MYTKLQGQSCNS